MKGWIVIHKIKSLYDNGNGLTERKINKELGVLIRLLHPLGEKPHFAGQNRGKNGVAAIGRRLKPGRYTTPGLKIDICFWQV